MTTAEAPDRSRPYVLLTNDDGFSAPGLLALEQALRAVARVAVVAPERNWSASGHSKTMHKPLRVDQVTREDGFTVLVTTGSPADCVALALLGLLPETPNVVVSGINPGANVGQDLTYSGTVGAAMESVIDGVHGIAVSLDTYEPSDYGPAAEFGAHLAAVVADSPCGEPLLLNVNVPALPRGEIRGVKATRLGRRLYRDALVKRRDPRGRAYYWIGGEPPSGVPDEGTDIGALAQGYISVTPLLLDLTDHRRLRSLDALNLAFPID